MSDPPPETVNEPVKVKKERTPMQLETLRLAREKAAKVRAENASIRRKQAEIDKAAAETVKKQKSEKLEREYAALTENKEKVEPVITEQEEEVEYVYKQKPSKKKRIVVVERSDSEDEEVEISLPKKTRSEKSFATTPPQPPDLKKKLYNKMFGL